MKQPGAVREGDRIEAVDVARGFALLGIFLVNIQLFAEPFGSMMDLKPPEAMADRVVKFATMVMCTGKFYLLFSMLFGIGFALQRERVIAAGRRWVRVYVRRLVFLAGLGLVHALGLWYGDILFIYAGVAVVLLVFGFLGARALMISGGAVFAFATLFTAVFTLAAFTGMQEQQARDEAAKAAAAPAETTVPPESAAPAEVPVEPAPPAPAVPPAEGVAAAADPSAAPPDAEEPKKPRGPFWSTPFGKLISGYKTQTIQQPNSREWQDLERRAYQEGPYLQLFLFRAMTWATMIVFVMLGFGWTVVGAFLFGAGLAKWGFFAPERAGLHRRLVAAGVVLGLPLAGVGVWLAVRSAGAREMALGTLLGSVGAPLITMAYLSAWTLAVNAGPAGWLTSRLAATGRMALTNYLTQTVVATTVFYPYGLGLYGRTDFVERLGLVLVVYAVQVLVVSPWWMSRFRYGPLEWLWRAVTYWEWPRMRRGAGNVAGIAESVS